MIRLLKTLSAHYGTYQNIFRWRSKSLDRLQALIETSPKGAVASMLRLMVKDWKGTKDGFPDLMIVESNLCRFIEIKAEGDVIRKHQLTRLRQLKTSGFQAEILKVNWTVDPNQTYVVVDVETTGGRPGLHRVTEIGAVKIRDGEIIDEWSSLINPQRSIPANITRYPGYASYSLKNLCREFQIDLKSHHRALCDAKAAAELLFLINTKRLENQ